jgi:ATP-dependent exoDNAse (exonuclease V) beta subunit
MESTFIKSVNLKIFTGSDQEYHDTKDHISKSGLTEIKVSPAHYKDPEKTEEESDALIFGSAYHKYILEPDKFEKEYYIFDDSAIYAVLIDKGFTSPRSTKEYKKWAESEMRVIGERKLLKKDSFERIKAMKERLFQHPYAKMLLSNGRAEIAYMGQIETEAGTINVKFKPDYIKDVKHVVVDLKTTKDASKKGFPREAAEHDYHIQASLYADLMSKVEGENRDFTFVFIAQEKKRPFAFNIFEAGPKFIAQGRYEYEMLLQLYKYCVDNNKWPGYQVFCQNKYGILELNLPAWAIDSLDYFIHK